MKVKIDGGSEQDSIKLFTFDYFNNGNKGFAIASGDQRLSSVYAIVENGNITDTTFNWGLKFIINNFSSVIKEELKQIQTNSISPQSSTLSLSNPIYLIKTTWGQRHPYNKTCQVTGNSCIPPAGCTAVALAQVIAYFDKPSSRFQGVFNHSAMTAVPSATNLTPNLQDMVAKFVHYCGVKSNMNYQCNASGAWPHNFEDFDLLGYQWNIANGAPSHNKLYNNIMEGRPAIIVGYSESEGHTWILDGMEYDYYNPPVFWYRIHCNFGWNGTDNGWFKFPPGEILDYTDLYYTLYIDGFDEEANSDNKTYTGPNE
ncbi:MAG: C10 family peptidase [Parabacteroides distasonis]